jgi:hypothetical protein
VDRAGISGGSRRVFAAPFFVLFFGAVSGAPLTYPYGTYGGMCFDYEIVFLENRGIFISGWVIRARGGIFLEEQKCSLLTEVLIPAQALHKKSGNSPVNPGTGGGLCRGSTGLIQFHTMRFRIYNKLFKHSYEYISLEVIE